MNMNKFFHVERFWTLTNEMHKLPSFRRFRAIKWLHLSLCVTVEMPQTCFMGSI